MKNFDLSGTLMYRDTELATFIIESGIPKEFHLLCTDPSLFPFEMVKFQNGSTLVNALLARIVPETRQGLIEELSKIGIEGYDISAILRHQNASSFEDDFWVKFQDGPQTWRELLAKIGYTVK